MRYLTLGSLAIALLMAPPVLAQSQPAAAQAHPPSQADFVTAFSGKWQIYEQRFAASGQSMCKLDFSAKPNGDLLQLTPTGCAAPLANAAAWSIVGSQLVLSDAQNSVLVKLGGNQKRVTGTTANGTPVILERAGGDGTASTLQAAYNASGCYYLGYTQTCGPRPELGEPGPTPDGHLQILIQTNLLVHSEPRADADTVGTAQKGTCVVLDTCTMASDGPWCRAKFGTKVGWLGKFALRQNRWPVVTYTNSCPAK